MKYGIQVWGDWGGETSFLWCGTQVHDEVYVKSFDSMDEAIDWLDWLALESDTSNMIIAPLPDSLCGRTEDDS